MKEKEIVIAPTIKTAALISAVHAGLVTQNENKTGYDTAAFEKFWDEFYFEIVKASRDETKRIIDSNTKYVDRASKVALAFSILSVILLILANLDKIVSFARYVLSCLR